MIFSNVVTFSGSGGGDIKPVESLIICRSPAATKSWDCKENSDESASDITIPLFIGGGKILVLHSDGTGLSMFRSGKSGIGLFLGNSENNACICSNGVKANNLVA